MNVYCDNIFLEMQLCKEMVLRYYKCMLSNRSTYTQNIRDNFSLSNPIIFVVGSN